MRSVELSLPMPACGAETNPGRIYRTIGATGINQHQCLQTLLFSCRFLIRWHRPLLRYSAIIHADHPKE